MKKSIVTIIPARGGSKGVPGKNIKILGGYPLIAYTIAAAKLTKGIQRIIVSTDSLDIARIAKKYGAEAPFMRPEEISRDDSTDLELFCHAIQWFKSNDLVPGLMIHLRPTTPLRDAVLLQQAIDLIQTRTEATSLRSIQEIAEPPQKMFKLNQESYLEGFFPDNPRPEYYNLPRQIFPKAYLANGYIDIIRTDFVLSANNLHGNRILGFITPATTEVDRPDDFAYLEYQLKKPGNSLQEYLLKNYPRED